MGTVSYGMLVSLDGFIESSNGNDSWAVPDAELHRHFNDLERATDVLLYGRRLYEVMAAYWPTVDEDSSVPDYELEYARIWRSKPKVVFSKTLDEVGWNSRLVRDNVAEEVQRLKAQPDTVISVGGAGLAASLMRLGLIDEVRLYIQPVILGSGKPMFSPSQDSISLRLVTTHTFGSGVVLLHYKCSDE